MPTQKKQKGKRIDTANKKNRLSSELIKNLDKLVKNEIRIFSGFAEDSIITKEDVLDVLDALDSSIREYYEILQDL